MWHDLQPVADRRVNHQRPRALQQQEVLGSLIYNEAVKTKTLDLFSPIPVAHTAWRNRVSNYLHPA